MLTHLLLSVWTFLFVPFNPARPQVVQQIVANSASTSSGGTTTSRVFNGSTAVLTNATSYLSGASAFSVAFWMKSASITQTNAYVMNFPSSGGGNAVLYGFVNSGGKAEVEFYDPNGTNGSNVRTSSQIIIPDTGWHHVAYTYNGTAWTKYLDGTPTTINASISFTLGSGGTAAFDAGNAIGGTNWYNGSLARLLITSTALTGTQVTSLSGATCSSSGISNVLGYWLLGSASPDPESSPSPNTNSLTVTNATTSTGPTCSSQ